MKYVSYAWLVIKNLITLSIAFLLYSIASSHFEIVIVSLLLVIYAHILTASSSIAMAVIISSHKSLKQFLHTLQILKKNDKYLERYQEAKKAFDYSEVGYPPAFEEFCDNFEKSYFDDEDSAADVNKQEEQLKKLTIDFYISGTFTFLIYSLAVWKIIKVLM